MSVTAPKGFVAAGGAVGIKGAGVADFALVATTDGRAVPAAAVFTSNLATAAPVQVSRAHLAATKGHAAGVVLTSGNANAATGIAGIDSAEALCAIAAAAIDAEVQDVLVCQTGLIGVPFPTKTALDGAPAVLATRAAGEDAGIAAATAIMTTDTVRKEAQATGSCDGGGTFVVGGMAKGAAMLAPNMATMLAVLTTDAAGEPEALRALLQGAVAQTFNTISVDGCQSTNDTVLLLASGEAGVPVAGELERAVTEVCDSLARQMVADAEGATKVVHIVVRGAASDADAHRAARQVADSLLVKCSMNGEDPYWGRVVSELGVSGAAFDLDKVAVSYGDVTVCSGGVAAEHDADAVAKHLAERHVEIRCDLGLGDGAGAVLTTDLGYGYIDENRTTS